MIYVNYLLVTIQKKQYDKERYNSALAVLFCGILTQNSIGAKG